MKFENYSPLKVKSKLKRLTLRQFEKLKRGWNCSPELSQNQNCLKKNLFHQRKKKRKLKILPSDNFKKLKRGILKVLFNVLLVRFMKFCFIQSVSLFYVFSKCERCIFSWAPTRFWSKFEIQIWNYQFAKVSKFWKKVQLCFFRETSQFENFLSSLL